MTITDYFDENFLHWDRLDCLTFLDCLTDLLSTFSSGSDWQTMPLYQKWLRHRYGRFLPATDEIFTMGDYHQLVSALLATLHQTGIK